MVIGIIKPIKLLFSLCSFTLTCLVILEFVYFISFPKYEYFANNHSSEWSWALLIDMMLLSAFIIQHSVMVSQPYKNLVQKLRLDSISRSLYIIATSGALVFLLKNWKITPDMLIWKFNLSTKPIYWTYYSLHITCWMIIYLGNICMDLPELLGFKQVYYNLLNLPDPNERKSHGFRNLTQHMRHPSFICLFLIFWVHPIMTYDRILLASILSSYMYLAWNTDGEDYHYHKYMLDRKYHELKRLQVK